MERVQRFTVGEEYANAISHGLGALLCLFGLVFLVIISVRNGSVWHVTSFGIFGATLLLLYLSSTFNHSLPHGRAKDFFHNFDQVAIYLLIAGTYTPFALIALNGIAGWTLFATEWGLAVTGIAVKFLLPNRFEKGVGLFTIISYVIMGWLIVFALGPITERVSTMGLVWLFAGGVFYTGGLVFFKMERLPYHHLIWHLFVIAGSMCHFVSVSGYLLPLEV